MIVQMSRISSLCSKNSQTDRWWALASGPLGPPRPARPHGGPESLSGTPLPTWPSTKWGSTTDILPLTLQTFPTGVCTCLVSLVHKKKHLGVIYKHEYGVKTEKFKFELDKFLDTIPDQPKMPNYVTTSGSNSILDQLTH